MDSLNGVGWICCTLLLGRSTWKLARVWFPEDSIFALTLHTLVLTWGCIVAVTVAIGLTGFLSAWSLLAGVFGATLGILLGVRFASGFAANPGAELNARYGIWIAMWLCVLVIWIAHVITGGLLKFPTDWDTLHYHLPLIDHWLQASSLYAPDCCLWSLPGNSEVIGLWIVAPFSGDYLISLNNLPIAVLMACAAIELGSRIGLMPFVAHVTALAVVCQFVVLNQLLDASNDLGVAGLFLAAAAYGIRFSQNRHDLGNAILFGFAIGLLAGVKYYALGYTAVAAFAVLLLAWKCRGWQRAAQLAAAAAIGVFVFGCYWYARNYWVTGSAVFPKAFDPDADWMVKIYPDIARTSFVGNGSPELGMLALETVWKMGGPLHVAAVVAAPLTLVWFVTSFWIAKLRGRPEALDARWAFTLLLSGAFAVTVNTPFAVEDVPGTLNQVRWHYCPFRYSMCFLSLSVLGLSAVLQDFAAPFPRLTWLPPAVVLIGALSQVAFVDARLRVERTEILIIAANLMLIAGNAWLLGKLWRWSIWPLSLAALMIGLGGAVWGIDHLADRWHRGFAPFYDRKISNGTFSELARTEPVGAICVLHQRAYPYFGSRRQHRVCQPVYVPSSSWLMNYLRDRRVQWIAIQANPARLEGFHLFEHFDECLRDHASEFRVVHFNRPVRVFERVEKLDGPK